MDTTTINVYNSITHPSENVALLFLQPSNPSETLLYSAWSVLDPSPRSYQSATLSTIFSASIANFADGRGDYGRPVELPLGAAWTISDFDGQTAEITPVVSPGTKVTPTQAGLYNDAVTPPVNVSVVWYVDHKKVVETNNTETTVLSPGFSAIFGLDQKVFLMLGQPPAANTTYTAQTVGGMVSFPIEPGATDLYLVAYTAGDGFDTFRSVTRVEWDELINQGAMA